MPVLIKNRQENGSISDAIMDKKPKTAINIEIEPENKYLEAAQALLDAFKANDVEGISQALLDLFHDLDAEPHEEGPHIQPHSYEAQKEG